MFEALLGLHFCSQERLAHRGEQPNELSEFDDDRLDVGRLPAGYPHEAQVALRFQRRVEQEQVDIFLRKHLGGWGFGTLLR